MRRAARLAWILLGLLAVFGAIHAPLHGDDGPCSPAGLCAGGVALAAVAILAFALARAPVPLRLAPAAERARRHPAFLVERGRAPPGV